MSELFVSQLGHSDSVSPWSNIKPVIITLDSDDEDSDTEEDTSGLPGRSKATTDLASCSNTAVESTSQSSLSSSSSESLRIAAWEQNVKATSGAQYDKQAAVKDDTKATEVIDLTQDDDDTTEQSENNKSFSYPSIVPQPLLSPVTAPKILKPFYESRPIVQKTLQYDTGYATLSKKNENSKFTRPSDEISMETSDEIATASPLTIYGSFTKAFNMKAQQDLPMDTYEPSDSMDIETYPDYSGNMDIDMDISRPQDYGHFNTFGLNNNSQVACQEEAMDLDEEHSLFTTFATPQILPPVYHFIADRPEPMEVDGTIRLSRAISRAPKTSVKVRRKRKKRDDYSDYDLQQKRKKF